MHLLSTVERHYRPGMDRRRFLLTSVVGAIAGPLVVEAQQAGRIARIGVLATRTAGDARLEGLLQGLRDLGYVEGRNLFIEYRGNGVVACSRPLRSLHIAS
jgi:putative ABC transport system substrate-binding protein